MVSTSNSRVALITGASSGIGTDFARELAARNFDLILSARRLERLQEQRQKLQAEFSVDVDIQRSDLSSVAGAQALFDAVQDSGRKVTLLVNNAGLGCYGRLVDQSLEQIQEMLQVNLVVVTAMTRWYAETMQKTGGGYILNHASFSGIQPVPSYAVYSATKAYVLALSLSVNQELRKTGVSVSALCPGFFQSEFFAKAGQSPGFFVQRMLLDRGRVARAGITGTLRRKPVIIPSFKYKLMNGLIRLFPRSLTTAAADLLNR